MSAPLAASAPARQVERGRAIALSDAGPPVRTLLVGTGPRALRVAHALDREPTARLLVGAIDDVRQPHLESAFPDVPWLGGLDVLPMLVHEHGLDEIRVALPVKSCFDEWMAVQALGRDLGIPVTFDLDLFPGARPHDIAVHHDRVVLSWNAHPARRFRGRACKRTLDVAGATAALILLAPLLVLAAIAVKLQSPGPLLFRQPRLGLGRRPFYMLKFRTMVADAEAMVQELEELNDARGILFKIQDDPRVTRIGRVLRRTSIDELPQLLNVLRGDMSLVGPRPLPVWEYAKLKQPTYHRRFSVLPGITGLWQVNGRVQDFVEMAYHDLRYVDDWSLWKDLRILAATVPAVLRGEGAH